MSETERSREKVKLNVPSLCAGGTSTREHLLQIHWEREGTKERKGTKEREGTKERKGTKEREGEIK